MDTNNSPGITISVGIGKEEIIISGFEGITGIEIDDKSGLSVYPSPFQEELNINLVNNYLGKIQIKLYDNIGKCVFEEEKDKSRESVTYKVKAENLKSGAYTMVISFGPENAMIYKLIKR